MKPSPRAKILSWMITFAILFTIVSPVSAATAQKQPKTASYEQVNQTMKPSDSEQLNGIEDVERREENVKHYILENGLYEGVVFPVPVHYKDPNDPKATWQDIDNSLESGKADGSEVYQNKSAAYKIQLAKKVKTNDSSWLVKLNKDNYQVKWSVLKDESSVVLKSDQTIASTEESTASIKDASTKAEEDKKNGIVKTSKQQRSDTDKLYSSVTYANLLPGCDFKYDISPTGVKENIIVPNPVNELSVAFELDLKNLTPVLQDDNSVNLVDSKNKTVMTMPRPNLLDQTEEFAYAVKLEISQTKKDTWLFRYTADPEYLKNATYPIALDPFIQTTVDVNEIRDASVFAGTPTTNYQTETYLYVGKGSTRGVGRTFIKFRTLPTLKASQRVHYAELEIYKRVSTDAMRMTAQRVLADWDSSTITWNNMPATDSNVEVYSNQSTLGDYTLDITGIAQEWLHNGVNNGVMLKAENETTYVYSYWSSDSTANQPPIVRFQYSDYAGLESSLSYHDVELAKGAALHVSDFNGNMVVTVPVVETQGNLLPVNLDLVYNSTLRNINVPDLMTGDGWRTTYDRTITWMVINGVEYYRYRDGDGTEHFFYSNGTNWVDEDGLGLTFDQTTLTITDLQDNKIAFYTGATANGRLKEIVDAQGNKVTVTQTAYGSTWCVTAVTDAAGRQTTYNRAADGTLQSITDPAGRATSLGYTGSKLTTITYPDNKTLALAYDANGNLTTLDDADGVRRSLTYQSANPYRVTQVSEAATNGSATGGYLNFAYSRNMTSVTDHLGKTTSYQFNNKGDCLCVIAPDGSAGFANYNDGGRLTHTASQVSNPQKFTANLLVNHSAEQSSTWTFSAANGTSDYATDKKYLGNQSIKLYKTSATGQNSATQTMTLEKGKTYTLSAFVSTDSVGMGGLGAGLAAAYESSAGVFTTINGRSLRSTQDFILENLTFTVPSNAYSGTVKLQAILDGTTGTAWFDCLQLESDKVANRYNIISNSDFDQTSSSLPVDWTRSATCGSSDIVINSASSGKPSNQSLNRMQLTGNMGAAKTVEQTLSLAGNAGDVYVFGAWGKGRSVPLTGSSSAKFAIELGFINGAAEEWKTLSFNEDSSYWQYVSGAAKASAAFTSIKIRLNYSYNANSAEFDAIQLFKEAFGSDYAYDSNGNITQQKSSDGTATSATYSSNNLTSLTLPNGQGYSYTYDSKHNPLTATSASGIGFAMTYDSYGNATSVKEGNDTTYIRNQAAYSSNGNYLTGMTDPFGNVTSYSYNTTKGTLSSTTLPNNQVTNYTYDANTDLLTGVSAVNDGVTYQNTYSYLNNSLLSGITHTASGGNVSYGFDYNELGWRTATKVGSQSLLSTVYEQSGGRYTGKVLKDVYGNGQEVSYDYDNDNRITGVRLNGTLRYEYAYDANSELSFIRDVRDGSIVWTVKDLAGRLSEVRSTDGSVACYTYNSASQFTKLTEILSGNTLITEYGYDNDERPTTAKYQTNYLQTTNYDSVLDRVSSIVRNVSGTDRLTTSFAYAPGASGNSTTSKRISALTNTGKSAINYSYDSLGNISVITQGSDRIEYYYDGLSQLVRENYSVGSTSYTRTFTYDAGGNIQNRNNYPYTTGNGTLGTPNSTDSYGYDTTWRDKLVSFNGQSITYDAIGNPTSYLGKTLTWTMGRQLESLSDASNNIQYTYNENGIRTKKTVNSTTTTYHLVGDVVTMEQTGSQTPIYYAYDGSGNLFLINYSGQNYFYVRNAQNDIIGLVDTSGNWVVEYQYDAWGKLLGTSGTLANTLGQANPYRYRGYRHDAETGLYYLNSRYYDPQVGRFVNADDIYSVEVEQGNLVQYNLFTYCLNNPINMSDDSGYCAANIIGGVIGGVAGAALGYLLAKYLGLSGWKKWALITAATVGGAVLGAFLGPYIAQLSRLAGTAIKAGFQPTISILKTASQAAFKAAKGVNKFSVSAKHLLGAGGRFAKFTTTSQSIIRGLIKTALTSSAAKFYSNGKDGSFYVLYSFGKAIGTKGEQTLKIVFDTAGKIWTAFPVK